MPGNMVGEFYPSLQHPAGHLPVPSRAIWRRLMEWSRVMPSRQKQIWVFSGVAGHYDRESFIEPAAHSCSNSITFVYCTSASSTSPASLGGSFP
ncbi:hypothetical protein RCH17_003817 [Arthrobacter sp. MP_M7]|nr:hypothetical protein [Arthrobacter sp. MP_M4]MEC5204985.1 hypothetical protein [Arthrobacter sp. MP_M7]